MLRFSLLPAVFALFLTSSLSFAETPLMPLRFDGHTSNGEACTLFVDHWFYAGDTQDWTSLNVVVRTPWQKEGNPALNLRRSPTPFNLYAINRSSKDQISIALPWGANSPNKIESFMFQSWDEERGLFQRACRFN